MLMRGVVLRDYVGGLYRDGCGLELMNEFNFIDGFQFRGQRM